jgi:hypothetical protein
LFPIHTLTNFEILDYAKLVGLPINCVAKDMTPKSIPNNSGIIVNLNDLGESGSHWVCAVRKNDKALYYDSYGVTHMPKEVEKCLKNSVKKNNIFVSDGQNQYLVSIMCGYYCLKICKSILLDNMDFSQAIKQFSDNPSKKNRDIADDLFI